MIERGLLVGKTLESGYDRFDRTSPGRREGEDAMSADVQHRPWPIPGSPWIMKQTWNDLLFAHWPVKPERILPTLPPGLRLDTFEGQAWIGLVPFWMSGVLPRGIPDWPVFSPLSTFPELNVRTYVTDRNGEKPGVWFYSLDAANRLAVETARRWFRLPYFQAQMRTWHDGVWVEYRSERTHPGAPPATLSGRYRPLGSVFESAPGTLESWLTDRFCLYSASRRATLYRAEIDHPAWPLQLAEGELRFDALVRQHRLRLPDTAPLLHFARRISMVAWPLEAADSQAKARANARTGIFSGLPSAGVPPWNRS